MTDNTPIGLVVGEPCCHCPGGVDGVWSKKRVRSSFFFAFYGDNKCNEGFERR